ncbi:MAG: DUF1579 family protein [Nannocystis sp.]|uniref:DUF1579 family protein n=1 Tax=Nannocystis sp. TaxID=1962667 RepID=UPI002421F0C8|nr:DUF1579 family protein [Nannocystis sp.]MBK9752985.1 DUF1579 family protein [Nannocystis sp.]
MDESRMQEIMAAMQRLAAPGPGHARLEALAGEWDTLTTMYFGPREAQSHGTVRKSWVLGRRFLQEELRGVGPDGRAYEGIGLLGHDNARGLYQGVWISDGMTGMTSYSGSADASGRQISFAGEESDPSGMGPARSFVSELVIDSPDTHTLTQFYVGPDGQRMRAFSIAHTRQR